MANMKIYLLQIVNTDGWTYYSSTTIGVFTSLEQCELAKQQHNKEATRDYEKVKENDKYCCWEIQEGELDKLL